MLPRRPRLLPGAWPAALLLWLLTACGGERAGLAQAEFAGSTMGTSYSVKLIAAPKRADRQTLQADVERLLGDVEQAMSTYLPDSELSRFNRSRSTEWFRVSAELCHAVAAAQSISARTGGAFDITVGPLVNLWGFGPNGAVSEPPEDERITEAMRTVGHDRLGADCGMPALRKELPDLYVDLSAVAKGYAVDQIAMLLDERGFTDYLIEIGGELRMRGSNARAEKWAIAVEQPEAGGRSVHAIVGLTDTALATSGDYRNFFEHDGVRYSHTIDPRTGTPVSHDAASVTVVSGNAADADAIATALLVLGPDEGFGFAERENIAAYFLLRKGNEFEERMTTRFARETAE